ncbi:hypothetical protein G7Y89_g6248 [Cudoniella acicularis]|uniref:Uncharacterized protein n=1 Tax=Cudoniella acicularis TaxID=354080 RepID=A0A8H4W371_9HELO|nr:hypothetical protein G7Y89_g6248 [Cudoniella acicularis]
MQTEQARVTSIELAADSRSLEDDSVRLSQGNGIKPKESKSAVPENLGSLVFSRPSILSGPSGEFRQYVDPIDIDEIFMKVFPPVKIPEFDKQGAKAVELGDLAILEDKDSESLGDLEKKYGMSGKITDARIEQLQDLRRRRDELIEKIQEEKNGMQNLLDLMDEETQDSTHSSSRAAKEKRGKDKDKSKFSHEKAIEIHELAIVRLEEDYAQVVKELEDLENII